MELHAIASKKAKGGGRFAVAMTAQENERFLTGIQVDHSQYYSMLGRVNAETSDCSRAADRASIHEGIRLSVGFRELSRMLFGVMEGWMEEQLRVRAAASAAAGDDVVKMEAMGWNATLAKILLKQGRCDEARVIFEGVLKFRRRVLPENHLAIGVMRFCLLICVFNVLFQVDAMGSLASVYDKLGRQQDALVLKEKTLEFWRRVLPENHPNIGKLQLCLLI
jgi:hypothetical protein